MESGADGLRINPAMWRGGLRPLSLRQEADHPYPHWGQCGVSGRRPAQALWGGDCRSHGSERSSNH
jgi:hypothetical protein